MLQNTAVSDTTLNIMLQKLKYYNASNVGNNDSSPRYSTTNVGNNAKEIQQCQIHQYTCRNNAIEIQVTDTVLYMVE